VLTHAPRTLSISLRDPGAKAEARVRPKKAHPPDYKIIDIIFYRKIMLQYPKIYMESAMKRLICILLFVIAAGVMVQAQEAKTEKTAKEYIADLSSGSDEKTLIEAAQYCGDKKEKDAVPGLINLLTDKHEMVRIESAIALGLIGEESAADALNNVLVNDESAQVRYAAILAALKIGSKKSLDPLKQAKEKDTDPFIQDLLGKLEAKAKK